MICISILLYSIKNKNWCDHSVNLLSFFQCPSARSCFLDDNFLDERKYDVSWKNWPPETESNSMDFLKYGHSEMSDYAFEESHLLKKRCSNKTDLLYSHFQEMTLYSLFVKLLYLCRDAATAMDRFNILGALSQLNHEIVPLFTYCNQVHETIVEWKYSVIALYILKKTNCQLHLHSIIIGNSSLVRWKPYPGPFRLCM